MAKDELYIACEEMNFVWKNCQVSQIANMWRDGESIEAMSKKLKRKPVEIVLLLIDLNWHSRIKKRPGGIFGN